MVRGNKKIILSIAAFFVMMMIGSCYFLFHDKGGLPGAGLSSMEFSGVDLKEERNGELLWKLKIDHGKVDVEKNIIYLEGIDGYFQEGENQLQITAKEGRWEKDRERICLEGQIRGKTKTGLSLFAENLIYDGKTGVLSTDKPFRIEKDGRELSADAFTADRGLEKITATGHATLKEKEAS